jgi:hypothetical protein
VREWCRHCGERVERAIADPMSVCVHDRSGLELCTSMNGELLGTLAAPTVVDPAAVSAAAAVETDFPVFRVIAQVVGYRAEPRVPGLGWWSVFAVDEQELRERLRTCVMLVLREVAPKMAAAGWVVEPVPTTHGLRLQAKRAGSSSGTYVVISDDPAELRREIEAG